MVSETDKLPGREFASGPAAASEEACRRHRESLIDEALMETFPASDPPSIARPVCTDREDVAEPSSASPDHPPALGRRR